jgi:hypothetical protein
MSIAAILTASRNMHAREAVQHLTQAVLEASGGQLRDEATALCLDWHGWPAPQPRRHFGSRPRRATPSSSVGLNGAGGRQCFAPKSGGEPRGLVGGARLAGVFRRVLSGKPPTQPRGDRGVRCLQTFARRRLAATERSRPLESDAISTQAQAVDEWEDEGGASRSGTLGWHEGCLRARQHGPSRSRL